MAHIKGFTHIFNRPLRGVVQLSVDDSGNPTNYVNISKYLQECAKACGINKHISSHTLRHSGITLLAELNIPLKQIMQRVGHSDYRTTISIYQKATAKMEEETINKLNALA